MPGKDLCLLSLDGGGVRGLSSLAILKRLMEIINPQSPPKPCDYFDMIGGTSTGGLMAIMLGRLQMDIDECITAYADLSDQVFKKKRHRVKISGKVQGRFDTAELERAIKEIVRKKEGTEDAFLKSPTCKTFVCAMSKEVADTVLFTSYPSRGSSDMYNNTRIWEAARATSAASSFFDPIKIGPFDEEFVDGAVGVNNPVAQLWNEAKFIWSNEDLEGNIKCLVSIGTGVPSLTPYGSSLLEIAQTLNAIAKETERTAESFHRTHSELDDGNRYFRFNVQHGLEDIGLEDAAQRNKIMAATSRYVALESVMKLMKLCGNNLSTTEYDGPYRVPFSLKGLPIVSKFIARDKELDFLKQSLLPKPTRNMRRKVHVLHGLGGIGKTQLAIEYARQHQRVYSSIFWLRGDSKDEVRRSIAGLARCLPEGQIPNPIRQVSKPSSEELDIAVRYVLQWFSKPDNNRWLLIFDNVDREHNPQLNDPLAFDVNDYFPDADHGSILITSRLRQLGQYGTDQILSRMDKQQGKDILEQRVGKRVEGAEKIVELLGGLPLALAHAGSFLQATATNVEEYIEFYKKEWSTLFGPDSLSLKDYPNRSIVSTWSLSYRQIEKRDPCAARMLYIFAHLDHSDLWYELFQPIFDEQLVSIETLPEWFMRSFRQKLNFTQRIQTLLDYSLIEIRFDSTSYSLHPVVHNWCFCSTTGTMDSTAPLALITIGSACRSIKSSAGWQDRQRLLQHCNEICLWAEEKTQSLQCCERWIEAVNISYHCLATFLHYQGKFREAEDMYLRALKGKEKTWGPDFILTLNTVNNLGFLYQDQGKLKEAEDIFQRISKGYENARGLEYPPTRFMRNLSLL